MPEVIVHQADVYSQQIQDFEVYIKVRPDGKAEVQTNFGMPRPWIVMTDGSLRISLGMPYTTQNQPLRLVLTKETETT